MDLKRETPQLDPRVLIPNDDYKFIKEEIPFNTNRIILEFIKDESRHARRSVEPFKATKTEALPLTVRFEPTRHTNLLLTRYARYDSITNAIIMYPYLAEESDDEIEAVLRHEKAHALFALLSPEDQTAIINAFLSHPEQLNDAIKLLCYKGYNLDYFSPDISKVEVENSKVTGRGIKVQHSIEVVNPAWRNPKGEKIQIEAAFLVDELLAHLSGISLGSFVEAELGSSDVGRFYRGIIRLFKSLNEQEVRLLSDRGFLNLQVYDLLFELNRDDEYRKLRKEIKSRSSTQSPDTNNPMSSK